MVGIYLTEGDVLLANNMIRLGLNAAGNSMIAPINISCFESNSTDNVDVWHNSFFVGGLLGNSISNTYCVKRNSSSNFNLTNNILVNNRSFSAGTLKRNFAIGIASNSLITGTKNCYFYSGAGASLGQIGTTDYDSIIQWRAASTFDSGSGRVNPNFVNATGSVSSVDLHVSGATPIESNGVFLSLISVDFDGQTRSNLTPNDIGADAGNFTFVTLPVKWKLFTAELLENDFVSLKFATTQEINNKEFVMERSFDGINFTKINSIQGKGNSNVVNNYFYNDNISSLNKEITTLYYRIKQVDFDGNFSYSTIEKVNLLADITTKSFAVYPNPANDKIVVSGLIPNINNELEIVNMNGQIVKKLSVIYTENDSEIDLSDLPKGIYMISVTGNSNKIKLVKL
jgi:hypothetical protein